MYNIRYAAVLTRQRGVKRAAEEEEEEEMSDASSDAADLMT